MARRFQHLGVEWEATPTGTGHGVGTGFLPSVDRWGFVFRRVSDPAREHRAHVSGSDAEHVTEDALIHALEEALMVEAIEASRYVWRTAEAISRETGIPLERVTDLLQTSSRDFITAERPNAQGLTLYSTRDHYRRKEPFLKRYLDNLSS